MNVSLMRLVAEAQHDADKELREVQSNRVEHAFDKQISSQRKQIEAQFTSATEERIGKREQAQAQLLGAGIMLVGAILTVFSFGAAAPLMILGGAIAAGGSLMSCNNDKRRAAAEETAGNAGLEVTRQQKAVNEATDRRGEINDRMRDRLQAAIEQAQAVNNAVQEGREG